MIEWVPDPPRPWQPPEPFRPSAEAQHLVHCPGSGCMSPVHGTVTIHRHHPGDRSAGRAVGGGGGGSSFGNVHARGGGPAPARYVCSGCGASDHWAAGCPRLIAQLHLAERPGAPARPARERRVPMSRQWMWWMAFVYFVLTFAAPSAAMWFGVAMAGVLLRDSLT